MVVEPLWINRPQRSYRDDDDDDGDDDDRDPPFDEMVSCSTHHEKNWGCSGGSEKQGRGGERLSREVAE